MPAYRFAITQKVIEEARVDVEAANQIEACAIMRAKVADGLVEWRFLESVSADDVEIVDVQEA